MAVLKDEVSRVSLANQSQDEARKVSDLELEPIDISGSVSFIIQKNRYLQILLLVYFDLTFEKAIASKGEVVYSGFELILMHHLEKQCLIRNDQIRKAFPFQQ